MAEVEEQPLERARVVEEHLEAQAQEEAVAASIHAAVAKSSEATNRAVDESPGTHEAGTGVLDHCEEGKASEGQQEEDQADPEGEAREGNRNEAETTDGGIFAMHCTSQPSPGPPAAAPEQRYWMLARGRGRRSSTGGT